MGTRLTKQQKQEWFTVRFNQAREKDLPLNKKMLIAAFCLDNFSEKKTALELIEMYEMMGIIKINENEVIVRR